MPINYRVERWNEISLPLSAMLRLRLTQENYGVGVPKDRSDLVRYVNAVLDQIRGNGVWQDSYRRWVEARLGPASPPAPQYQ